MASLDDILTTQKNGVLAINSIAKLLNRQIGSITSQVLTSNTLIIIGPGYLVNYSVIVSGAAGSIHNASSVASASASNALTVTLATAGVHQTGVFFTDGLVVKPGAGQSVNVTYITGG